MMPTMMKCKITNGARLETYPIVGPRRSGVVGINGAAARLVRGDRLAG